MKDEGPILLVSPFDETAIRGGRDMVSAMNLAVLSDLHGDTLLRFRLRPGRSAPRAALLHGHIDGIDDDSIAAINRIISERGVGRVFLDGSNLGALARAIRRERPRVRIITFCHNVETSFFLGALRYSRTPRATAILLTHAMAERAAVRSSDVLICLSHRDGRIMRRIHGRAPDIVLPLAITDSYRSAQHVSDVPVTPYALFVGGGFYANIDGIRWYLRKVAADSGLQTVIVGRGLDGLSDLCRGRSDVLLVGEVDDLAPWYRAAHVVIAPILSGSGMKTKVAEALMHGKHVIGTPEAFSGYDDAIGATAFMGKDAESFGKAVRNAAARELPAFDPAMRALYDRFHSFTAARDRMAEALARSR